MRRIRLKAMPAFGILLAGCNGQLYHGPAYLDRPVAKSGTDGSAPQEAGIIYYPRMSVLKTTIVTKLNKDTGNCETSTSYDIITIADTSAPQRLYYKAAWLESYKFSATLNADGTLASVGTESTPDQGSTFKNIAGGIASLGSAVAGFAAAAEVRNHAPGERPATAVKPCLENTKVTFARFDPSALPEKSLP